MILSKVTINLNMLNVLMKQIIVSNLDKTLIGTIERSWIDNGYNEITNITTINRR